MKFWKYGRVVLALIVSLGMGLSFIACGTYTIGYLYVTSNGVGTSTPGQQLNQIGGYKIDHDFGYLTPITGSPFPANGNLPVQAVIFPGGQLMAVLNKGSNDVSIYNIGGSGVLTFQDNYYTSGSNPVSLVLDPSGQFLYVADQVAPDGSGKGDITAFQINSSTGKLTLLTNQNVFSTSGTQLPYFEVNYKPVQLVVEKGFLFVLDQAYKAGSVMVPAAPSSAAVTCTTAQCSTPDVFPYAINSSNGQLVLTQNQPLQTGSVAGALTTMATSVGGTYLYIADQVANQILPYTVGTGGVLQILVGGPVPNNSTAIDPDAILVNNNSKFLYLANFGPASVNQNDSTITAYTIDPTNGELQFIAGPSSTSVGTYPSGSGPMWMVEDPSNQYLYEANYNDNTINGYIIDANTGQLAALFKGAVTSNVPQHPNYLVVTGRVF